MRVLKYGMSGPDVELLQLGMKRAGYYSDEIDGVFGPRTRNALRRFQASFGLNPDGIAGPATWRVLRPFIVGYFRTQIRSGDTFYRLAKRYDTTVNAIASANPSVDADNLRIGDSLIIPYGFDLVPTNVHYTSELMEYIVEGMAARYPFISVGSIGKSVTGKPLHSIIIGAGEKQAFYNASHHANEWITTPLVLKFAESYLKAYIDKTTILGRNAESLYNSTKLFLVPMVNPDGVDLVNGAFESKDKYYREAEAIARAYPTIRFPDGWKANIAGTDLNLNYPAGWERAKEIKFARGFTSPAPRDYVGTAPLSAPESRAVYDFTRKNNFLLILAYHTQGQVIYWKYQDIEPPRGYEIGQALAQVSGYALDTVPDESSFAGYKDWFILDYNRPGYTVEAGLGMNPLPIAQFNTMYRDNLGIMVTALEAAAE